MKVLYKKYCFRGIVVFVLFCMFYILLGVRIYYIQNDNFTEVVNVQSKKIIFTSTTRGYIYDRNGQPLVNDDSEYEYYILSCAETDQIVKNYSHNYVKNGVLIRVSGEDNIVESPYVKRVNKIVRYSDNMLCRHIIGYTDCDGYGVCGIEKAFDLILDNAKGQFTLSCTVNAKGEILAGDGFIALDDNYNSPAGIYLTIDKEIQKIIEEEISKSDIKKGAVVVMDSQTSEIAGIVSVPMYNVNDLSSSLNDENLPFFNRALGAYPVGSVIKPFIALAAMQNGYSLSSVYECNGNVKIDSNVFGCYNSNIHGKEDINMAIQNSCNCFFIDMGIKTGAENVINLLASVGFGQKFRLCSTLISEKGVLPSESEICSSAQLANLCFGQGELLATPVQIAAAYSCIANGGVFNEPIILSKLSDDNGDIYGYYKSDNSKRVLSREQCEIVSDILYNNMLNGTGINAQPDNITAAGKTATAQTGEFDESGKERLCTWFAGYFPYDNPMYTIVVFNEDGSTASEDCAPVFRAIAERISLLN